MNPFNPAGRAGEAIRLGPSARASVPGGGPGAGVLEGKVATVGEEATPGQPGEPLATDTAIR